MNINEAARRVLDIFPNATFGEDNDGQIVIYTDTKLIGDTLTQFEVE